MMNWKSGGSRTLVVLLFVVGYLFPLWEAEATHLRAGQITVQRISCIGRTYRITVTVYTDRGSPVLFGGEQDILDFGDGNRILIPETQSTEYPGIPDIGVATFETIYTYGGPGQFTISYLEPNRNEGVLNIENSVLTTFYIETQIDLTVLGCDNSPQLRIPPIDQACVGVAFFHNPGAFDEDPGDSLSYELVVPFRDRATPVSGYRDPNDESFYTDYAHGNEDGSGPPEFNIDPVDGTITWNAPGKVGEYNIAFIVKEWRNIGGVWKQIGFVRRDMQIIVASDCTNERPQLDVPDDICVDVGTPINEIINGLDPDNHKVKIEAFSEIFEFDSNPTLVPSSGVFQSSPATVDFSWTPTCEDVQDQPYLIVFKITDDPTSNPPKSGPPLVAFATWRITVVAPAPVLQPATVNLATRHVTLNWDAYDCFHEAQVMQVWRRVDDTNYTPDECVTGIPESLGFSLIAQVPIKNGEGPSATPVTTFTDTNNGKGLEAAAKYCYRLVAVFPSPRGGESYVSNEVCIDPIDVDEPVITNVTVDKTGDTDGEITVRWTPPFEIDLGQFPGPKEYVLQRADGTGFINVSPQISDTVFTDAGLDTRDVQYFYRVVLYSGTASMPAPLQPVDTSSLASSVWLDLSAKKRQIDLSWSAVVSWSNQLQSYPMHRVYRGGENATEVDLVLIDSANVIQDGLTYLDTGKLAPGDTLNGANFYCYRVMTRGGYGNDDIKEPLINYSQINCAKPTDDNPPCVPVIAPFDPDFCKQNDAREDFFDLYTCSSTTFKNIVRWFSPTEACAEDIRYYNVYAATVENGTYELIATNVRDTFYVHDGLATLAYCYRVTAVDRSNNESDPSEIACNNNCPNYELPNVFSPNGDKCNDLFSAFGITPPSGEIAECKIPTDPQYEFKCARFVQRVDFTVYNRWGKKLYHYIGFDNEPTSQNTIYLNWNGHDDKGRELSTGVYYYVAEVTFDVVDPNKKNKIVKGWVHLVR